MPLIETSLVFHTWNKPDIILIRFIFAVVLPVFLNYLYIYWNFSWYKKYVSDCFLKTSLNLLNLLQIYVLFLVHRKLVFNFETLCIKWSFCNSVLIQTYPKGFWQLNHRQKHLVWDRVEDPGWSWTDPILSIKTGSRPRKNWIWIQTFEKYSIIKLQQPISFFLSLLFEKIVKTHVNTLNALTF